MSLKKNRLYQKKHKAKQNACADVSDDNSPLNHGSEFGGRHVSSFRGVGHFGFGSVASQISRGQVQGDPELRYLDDGALIAGFERFVVFNTLRPRHQIGVLALDEEHAVVEGANYLELPRRLVAVVRTPGFLQSSSVA